jgi:hypothetical protein
VTHAGRGGAWLLLAVALPLPAQAQFWWEDPRYQAPPTLPESISGVVRPGPGERLARIDRIREVFQALQACWEPPRAGGLTGEEITLRFAFRRNGEVLGEPRITYYTPGSDPDRRATFTRTVREALARCAPLPFTPAFGAAVAGRPFTVRFSDTRPL